MPLPNRVTPFGGITTTTARGAWMGNRGQLHGKGKTILRPFKLKAWITCLLEFKNWHRPVMAPMQYTELFFMDEATAFAAGHRPCFECRRADYQHFKTCWLKGNSEYGFNEKTSIREIDEIMHCERIDTNGQKVTFEDHIKNLPDGIFIQKEGEAFLIANGQLFRWTPFGYDQGIISDPEEKVMVLTPRSTINAFKAGYVPQMSTSIRSSQ